MATHADIGNAFRDPDDGALFVRFLGACLLKAGAIKTESDQTPNHTNRVIWADGVLSQDMQAVFTKVRAVKNYALATDADVQYSPTDVIDASITAAVENALAALANGS